MEDSYTYELDNDMPFEEKDQFWQLVYSKISKAVKKKYDFTIIFHMDEQGLENPEGYSVIVRKDDYDTFLKNFLLWSEDLERYETCIEVQSLIKELEQWKKTNID